MRDFDQAVLDALGRDTVWVAALGEFDFVSGVANLWAGPEGHALDYDSKTWVSVGEIGQIDKIAEGQGLADSTTTVSLNINSDNVDIVEVEDSRGRAATVTILFLSEQGQPIGPANFRYTMGQVRVEASVSESGESGKRVNERILLDLLSETSTLEQSHFVRMTYAAGLRIQADDHGLEFVADPEMPNLGAGLSVPGRNDGPGTTPFDLR